MEPLSFATVISEKVIEQEIINEGVRQLGEATLESSISENLMFEFDKVIESSSYNQVNEMKQLAITDPSQLPRYINDSNIKGKLAEAITEAKLNPYGEVSRQVQVSLGEGYHDNIVDLYLKESNSNIAIQELSIQNEQVVLGKNYDLVRGESAAFEVKNGTMDYLRNELGSGKLQQQIKAGESIGDHSFVLINESTAMEMLEMPEKGETLIKKINDAGGRVIVGLPKYSEQLAMVI